MNNIHPDIKDWLIGKHLGEVISVEPASGGCIHHALRVRTDFGGCFFLKQDPGQYPDIFLREAEGLEALRVAGGPVIPEVHLVSENYLLLSDLQPAPRCAGFWSIYGRQLARVHLQQHSRFGFAHRNYIGSNPQENTWMENGHKFFREQRLMKQIRWAEQRSLLERGDLRKLDNLLRRLPDLIPVQPATLIHGDLWSGNLITDSEGNPALIDPAVYYGWAEADLAMTDLFGSYPDEFYGAYREIHPLQTGYRSRYSLYNLYHLLNHLNIFGREYLLQIRAILDQY